MIAPTHPPAPWRLDGRALLLPAVVRRPPDPATPSVRTRGGRGPGGLLLADYGPRSTLVYHELLGVGGVVWAGVTPAAWVTHAHVDDAASLAGGREIWGIAKEDAAFAWERACGREWVTASVAGRELVSVSVAARRRSVFVPVAAPFAGRDASKWAWALGSLRATPAAARVHIPPDSPLASLEPAFSRVALVGEVRLRITAPRAQPSR